ncbi:MAG TPA: efflux RND transporter periplasmic adaptor subunit, partial [Candidatus Udaeobacter sp.]|nr:efflux RND transporter periplasmic adaptor subunit [Candidatus Udaeobacter sp.]
VTVLAILVIIGVWHRISQRHDQENFAQRTTQLEVNVATAQRDSKPKELILPGTFQAFNQTTIFPRSNGYVESWKVDIGDYVQAGQLLAEIATPEVDQQLAQARAQEEIAKLTADRWRDLLDKKVVSKQEYDQNEKAYEAAKANLQQLEKIQGFQQILAPFAGKIAARNIDVGTLVTAGTGNSGTPLFSLVQSDVLRVYVFAPQENAPSIHEGLAAKIVLQEYPGQEFDGKVTRTAGALDPQSRTMQVEVQVPNQQGKLYAGMYGQVKFLLPDDNAPIVVPADAFVFRAQGPQVVTVTNDNRIHWKISVGRDFGTQLEVLNGLKENTEVVMNPTDDLREGVQVEVKSAEESKPGSTVAQSSSTR